MSVPGYEPLSRPPREGDPVKVVVTGRIEGLSRDRDEGREYAEVLLDLGGEREIRIVVPADEVWNQARPDGDSGPRDLTGPDTSTQDPPRED